MSTDRTRSAKAFDLALHLAQRESGLRQRALAVLLANRLERPNNAISRATLSAYRSGRRPVDHDVFVALCAIAGYHPADVWATVDRLYQSEAAQDLADDGSEPVVLRRAAGGRLHVLLGSLAYITAFILLFVAAASGSLNPVDWYRYLRTQVTAPPTTSTIYSSPLPMAMPVAAREPAAPAPPASPALTPPAVVPPDVHDRPGASDPPPSGTVAVSIQNGNVDPPPPGVVVDPPPAGAPGVAGSINEAGVSASGSATTNGTQGCIMLTNERGQGVRVCGTISPQQPIDQHIGIGDQGIGIGG